MDKDSNNYNDFFDSEEFKNMSEHSKEMIRKLMELNNIDNIKDSLFEDGDTGAFIQRLDDNEFNTQLERFISNYKMTQKINILDNHELGDRVIEEIWSSSDDLIKLKRYYELNYENVNYLRPESRKVVYEILLEEALEKEDYEKAAEIRDSIYLNE